MKKILGKRIDELTAVLDVILQECGESIEQATELIAESYRNGGGVFLFGNGGSAADAQHIAGELNGRFLKDRRPLKAQALSADSSVLTCIGNDYACDQIFSRPLEANGREGDVAWALSTSGNSPNVVEALKKAKELGLKTIAMTGQSGGKCADIVDVLISIPSDFTPHIQEAGTLIYHCICEQIEQALFESN